MSARNSLGALPRRRNGKQQACEPCRKAKMACDHGLPICERCKRRNAVAKCVYLAAPMTRPSLQENGSSGKEPHSLAHILTPAPSSESQSLPNTSPNGGPGSISKQPPSTSKHISTPSSGGPFIKSGGFFGPTNFSAVFLENGENLDSDNTEIQISNDSSEGPLPTSESLQSQTFLMLARSQDQDGNPRVILGAKVLRALPDRHTCNFLLEWYYDKCHECVFHKHSVMSCSNSVWSTYGSFFKDPRKGEDLEHVSEVLCNNSKTVLEEPSGSDDYTKWLDSFCGDNLRWESLGIVYSALASATLSLPERDAFFTTQRGNRKDRKSFAVEMKDCVQACITLSNYMDLINLPMVALLTKNLILQTVISGDTSLVVWRQLGDLVSSSTALGLHRQLDHNQQVSFLPEMKKRLFTVIFNIDKGSSLLTGRPPALSYRYTRFKHPLDLSDDAIMRGGDQLVEAVSRLDPNGWNTDGEIHSSTMIRAHGLLSIVLNEILELSLGDPAECSEDRIRYLLNRLQQTYNNFPAFLHFQSADPCGKNSPDKSFWTTLCLRLQFLEHRLLLERLAHKQGVFDGQSMIDCAREMLELTVLIWVQRDRFVEYHHDFDWMLMCWGVPSSGVLCVELLKQLKHPEIAGPRLPRSEVVQNLSLLIGFLEWVRPAAGNYQLCMRMRLIIKRILDQILDPSPPTSQSVESVASQETAEFNMAGYEAHGMVGLFETAVPPPAAFDTANYGSGLVNLDWLNSVDWSRGPWIDLGGQEFGAMRWSDDHGTMSDRIYETGLEQGEDGSKLQLSTALGPALCSGINCDGKGLKFLGPNGVEDMVFCSSSTGENFYLEILLLLRLSDAKVGNALGWDLKIAYHLSSELEIRVLKPGWSSSYLPREAQEDYRFAARLLSGFTFILVLYSESE
ncbi:hypothetical protein G7Y89_g3055 [Cudoniella acicularis]|uniref:Zn(2)-C6 fungal-type domain-containing protein n=1 Tax=Cudoniella acicularis TaxID=354080 RepID=A0A8H4RTC0_9HELO|nr:hypothetical protein G7Y89_g3055 [Cudoniella acicularis]